MTKKIGGKSGQLNRRTAIGLLAMPLVLPAATVFANTSRLNAMVVGCGNRGTMLGQILSGFDQDVAIWSYVDLDRTKAEALRMKADPLGDVFATVRDAVARNGKPDIAVIATYNNTHWPLVRELTALGTRIYTEKPMTATLEDAADMIALDQSLGGQIQVGLQFRHAPLYAEVKRLIDAGTIGMVRYIAATELRGDWFRFHPGNPELEAQTNWRYFEETCGNSILEKLCHDIDILCHVSGLKPVRVIASGGKAVYRNRETDDHASIILEFADDAKLDLSFSLFSNAHRTETVIIGDHGSLSFERTGEEIRVFEGKGWARALPDRIINVNPDKKPGFGYHGTAEGLQAFIHAVKTDGDFYPKPLDAWLSAATCSAAHQSARNGAEAVSLTQGRFGL